MKKIVLACIFVLAFSLSASAQITGYQVSYFNAGATQPLQQGDLIPPAALQCGQPKLAASAVNPINPTQIRWDDPNNSTLQCVFNSAPSSSLQSFPVGSYDAVVVVVSAAGNSVPSNRATFSRAATPNALSGLVFTR